jgi:hypothetical protein
VCSIAVTHGTKQVLKNCSHLKESIFFCLFVIAAEEYELSTCTITI